MMNIEKDNVENAKFELKARSISIIVVAILLAGMLAGMFAGMFAGPRLAFDTSIAKCQKQCEIDHPGDDAASISKKLNCQLACY